MVDTLFYFHPDSLESVAYTGDVLDLAVHFQVPTGWQRFDIRELGILTPGPQTAHLGEWLYICSFNDSLQPGDVIDSVQVNIQDNPSSSPLWTVIDLSDVVSLQGMTGDFWVRGPALFTGLIDNSVPSGHSYWYVIEPGQTRWGPSADIPVRAVVQEQSDSLTWLDYFPHHIGDKWLYRVAEWPHPSQEEYELVEIVGDTVMENGHRYLHFSGHLIGYPDSRFFRIDTADSKIYEYSEYSDTAACPSREVLRFDFSWEPPYDSIWGYSYQNCESLYWGDTYIWRESGSALVGIDTLSAPYYLFGWFLGAEHRFTYSKGFGLTYWHLSEIMGYDGYLVAAEIDGIHYGEPFAIVPQPGFPGTCQLFDPYPNPFNPSTTIRYQLPQASEVTLIIFDLLGREVATLVEGYNQPGTHEATWDAGYYPSGIYLASLVTPGFARTIKLVLLK